MCSPSSVNSRWYLGTTRLEALIRFQGAWRVKTPESGVFLCDWKSLVFVKYESGDSESSKGILRMDVEVRVVPFVRE